MILAPAIPAAALLSLRRRQTFHSHPLASAGLAGTTSMKLECSWRLPGSGKLLVGLAVNRRRCQAYLRASMQARDAARRAQRACIYESAAGVRSHPGHFLRFASNTEFSLSGFHQRCITGFRPGPPHAWLKTCRRPSSVAMCQTPRASSYTARSLVPSPS